MLTPKEIRDALADANLKRVALKAGIHPATLYRFMKPDYEPLYGTVRALSEYLEGRGK